MRQILYKRDLTSLRVVLKPDTFYWRTRYWLNHYLACFSAFLILPVVRLNARFFRLDEGDEIASMTDIARLGMIVKEPEPFLYCIRLPWFILRKKEWLQRAFEHFRSIEEDSNEDRY